MKQYGKNQSEKNFIDEDIKTAFGFSKEQLEKMLDDATEHRDELPSDWKAPKDEFATIMAKINQRGIQPVPLEDEHKKNYPDSSRRHACLRRMVRTGLIAAALAITAAGFCINATGKSQMKYKELDIDGDKNNIAWNNVKTVQAVGSIDEAYGRIKKELGIPALRLGYLPDGIKLQNVIIEENGAILKLLYNTQTVYFYQVGQAEKSMGSLTFEREKYSQVYNAFLKIDIDVYREEDKSGGYRYSSTIKTDAANYTIIGVLEEAEFLKMVEYLYYAE